MSGTPRTASDVLLSLESKLQQLIELYRSQDLVLKLSANKINILTEKVDNFIDSFNDAATDTNHPPFTADHGISAPIKISADFTLPIETAPKGFRRTSRPETYDKNHGKNVPEVKISPPPSGTVLPPKNLTAANIEASFANVQPAPPAMPMQQLQRQPQPQQNTVNNSANPIVSANTKIPVIQRVVDQNGKAIYSANVKIINTKTHDEAYVGRTNGIGKWQTSLTPGSYKVMITKLESASRERYESSQEIEVDGLSTTQELPILICR